MTDPTDTPPPQRRTPGTTGPVNRRRRADIPREVAEQALVTAAIELAREHRRLAEVTVRGIAERAGLNVAHITRYFGSRDALLLAARERLGRNVVEQFVQGGGLVGLLGAMHNNPDLVLRVRISAYLLLDGVDPERFESADRTLEPIRSLIAEQLGVGERAARAVTTKMNLLLLASATFAEIAAVDEADALDLLALVTAEHQHLPEFERQLGWVTTDDPQA